jgi:hypothetical protein
MGHRGEEPSNREWVKDVGTLMEKGADGTNIGVKGSKAPWRLHAVLAPPDPPLSPVVTSVNESRSGDSSVALVKLWIAAARHASAAAAAWPAAWSLPMAAALAA